MIKNVNLLYIRYPPSDLGDRQPVRGLGGADGGRGLRGRRHAGQHRQRLCARRPGEGDGQHGRGRRRRWGDHAVVINTLI